jgi:hypothetical protein
MAIDMTYITFIKRWTRLPAPASLSFTVDRPDAERAAAGDRRALSVVRG